MTLFRHRRLIFGGILTALLISFSPAFADVDGRLSTDLSGVSTADRPNRIQINLLPTLVSNYKGGGLNYQRQIGEVFSVGPFLSYTPYKPYFQIFSDVEFQTMIYGLEARLKPSGFDESGFYIGAAVVQAESQGRGKVSGLLTDGQVDVRSNRYSRTGWRAQLGWMLEAKAYSFGQFFLDLALNYGLGEDIKYHTKSSGTLGGKTESGSLEILGMPDTLGLVGAIGLSF